MDTLLSEDTALRVEEEKRQRANGGASFPSPEIAGPTARVKLGVERNQAAVPELYPFRALAVTRGSWWLGLR